MTTEAPQALPRPAEECDHGMPVDLYCDACTIDKLILERDALAVRVRELEAALDCVIVDCLGLHHSKKDRHTFNEPCPVEGRISAALTTPESKP